MRLSEKGRGFIKTWEGFSLTAYQCSSGTWTVGVGHTKGVEEGDVISAQAAEDFLTKDIAWAENAVNLFVKVPLKQNQFDALVSFIFNVGREAFRTSTLLRLLNEKKYEEAAEEFLRWDKSGGVVSLGLVRRREAERNLFES